MTKSTPDAVNPSKPAMSIVSRIRRFLSLGSLVAPLGLIARSLDSAAYRVCSISSSDFQLRLICGSGLICSSGQFPSFGRKGRKVSTCLSGFSPLPWSRAG